MALPSFNQIFSQEGFWSFGWPYRPQWVGLTPFSSPRVIACCLFALSLELHLRWMNIEKVFACAVARDEFAEVYLVKNNLTRLS